MTDNLEKTVSDMPKPDTPSDKMAEDIEGVLAAVLNDRPKLRSLRESSRADQEPQNKFAREFLKAFRQRMQG